MFTNESQEVSCLFCAINLPCLKNKLKKKSLWSIFPFVYSGESPFSCLFLFIHVPCSLLSSVCRRAIYCLSRYCHLSVFLLVCRWEPWSQLSLFASRACRGSWPGHVRPPGCSCEWPFDLSLSHNLFWLVPTPASERWPSAAVARGEGVGGLDDVPLLTVEPSALPQAAWHWVSCLYTTEWLTLGRRFVHRWVTDIGSAVFTPLSDWHRVGCLYTIEWLTLGQLSLHHWVTDCDHFFLFLYFVGAVGRRMFVFPWFHNFLWNFNSDFFHICIYLESEIDIYVIKKSNLEKFSFLVVICREGITREAIVSRLPRCDKRQVFLVVWGQYLMQACRKGPFLNFSTFGNVMGMEYLCPMKFKRLARLGTYHLQTVLNHVSKFFPGGGGGCMSPDPPRSSTTTSDVLFCFFVTDIPVWDSGAVGRLS